jgi:multidrug efflux system membrane fusion protein
MRIVPIITAVLVSAALYVFVFERDRLSSLTQGDTTPASVSSDTQTDEPTQADASDPDSGVVKVVVQKSQARMIDSAVILRGETQAARSVTVRAETSGQIINDPLRKGHVVTAGDILCQIDPGVRSSALADARARLASAQARIPETAARVAEANARLDEARINFNAANKLSETGFASETRVASAQAGVRSAEAAVATATSGLEATKSAIQSAEAAVESAQKELDRVTITAPFGGLLETDTAELGSLMQPGAACATIVQLDPIKVVGFVPETALSRVTIGAPARAKLTGGRIVQGLVTFISRSADPVTRTFRIEIDVANTDQSISDGQTAEIVIAAEGDNAHLLPQSSLTLNDAGTLGVRIVVANTARFVPVTLVRDTIDGVWVTGLPAQADVIVIGQEYVRHGVRVAPTYQGEM